LGGKPRGRGAHREAEVAAMVAPNPTRWRCVRCPRPVTRACGVGKEGVAVLEVGREGNGVKRGTGYRPAPFKSEEGEREREGVALY
jgi:hypothetical protein